MCMNKLVEGYKVYQDDEFKCGRGRFIYFNIVSHDIISKYVRDIGKYILS